MAVVNKMAFQSKSWAKIATDQDLEFAEMDLSEPPKDISESDGI